MGDLERCRQRSGNVYSAEGLCDVLVPVVECHKGRQVRVYFRSDAAFASPGLNGYLEAKAILYAVRLPAKKFARKESLIFCAKPLPPRKKV
jgi:hypothetical protein